MIGDTANAISTDLDVALVTPGWAPRVLDEEVVLSGFVAIADSEDTVVKLGSAAGTSDNTTGVTLEGHLVGLNGNGDGLLGNGGLEGSAGLVSRDIVEGFNANVTSSFHVFVAGAGNTVSGGIRIRVLGDHRGLLGVLESVVHETTVATGVDGRALDELLLREGDEVAGGNEVSTLEGSGGGESPA